MTDETQALVERLQAEIERQRINGGDLMTYGTPDPWLRQSIDTIEDLRGQRDALAKVLRYVHDLVHDPFGEPMIREALSRLSGDATIQPDRVKL